jgi:hypothetical protein
MDCFLPLIFLAKIKVRLPVDWSVGGRTHAWLEVLLRGIRALVEFAAVLSPWYWSSVAVLSVWLRLDN